MRSAGGPRLQPDPRSTTAREVAVREGAKAVVVGDISPIGKGLVLSAKVLAAVDGAALVAVRETADDESEILKAIDRLSKRVRERIGESLRSIRSNEPLDEVTTGSLEALRLYTKGRVPAIRESRAGRFRSCSRLSASTAGSRWRGGSSRSPCPIRGGARPRRWPPRPRHTITATG